MDNSDKEHNQDKQDIHGIPLDLHDSYYPDQRRGSDNPDESDKTYTEDIPDGTTYILRNGRYVEEDD